MCRIEGMGLMILARSLSGGSVSRTLFVVRPCIDDGLF